MSETLTVTAAAKELEVGERTVRRYLDAGKLDGATPEGKQRGVKITRESLDALLAERSANGQAPDTDRRAPDIDHNVTDALVGHPEIPLALRYFGGAGKAHMDKYGTKLETFAAIQAICHYHVNAALLVINALVRRVIGKLMIAFVALGLAHGHALRPLACADARKSARLGLPLALACFTCGLSA